MKPFSQLRKDLREDVVKQLENIIKKDEPSKVTLKNGANTWAFESSQYVQAAVKNVEDYLSKQNKPNCSKDNHKMTIMHWDASAISNRVNPNESQLIQDSVHGLITSTCNQTTSTHDERIDNQSRKDPGWPLHLPTIIHHLFTFAQSKPLCQ